MLTKASELKNGFIIFSWSAVTKIVRLYSRPSAKSVAKFDIFKMANETTPKIFLKQFCESV